MMGLVIGSYEYGNEPSGSIKRGDCLDWLNIVVSSQGGGLCSSELVTYKLKPQKLPVFYLQDTL
jgi:hypothetical protein